MEYTSITSPPPPLPEKAANPSSTLAAPTWLLIHLEVEKAAPHAGQPETAESHNALAKPGKYWTI